jgi:murein DD-endopeptidase MepM/ murein hydrolase activator NlpD
VVPSAVRTLSVVTLLSAVSGTVAMTHTHHTFDLTPATDADGLSKAQIASAALITDRSPGAKIDNVAYLKQQQIEAQAQHARQQQAQQQSRLELKRKLAAKAKAREHAAAVARAAKAEAAAARRRAALRARATRSAVRDPKAVARLMVADRGWGSGQFSCLNSLWNRESGWNLHATNPSSGAYGIPQALPGSKMSSAGSDWRSNPVTQIRWGLNYISDRYGTPCGAWGHSEATGWY